MATNNPLRKPLNRAEQLPRADAESRRGISLYDVDSAIFNYMNDIVVPTLKVDNAEINVPVIYGNAERWKAAQIDGVYRDKRGKIQLPLIMFKRTTVARNEAMPMLNRFVHYPSYQKYSKKNIYDKFSLLNNFQPRKEVYDVTMPDYVDISYEVMIWTNFTEHMNTIVESFKWAADEYWGDKDKFKFKVEIDSFDKVMEMTDNAERIVRTEFTMLAKAYLIPERFDNEATTKKSISTRAVITTLETDVSGKASSDIQVNDYNANKILYDYLEINNSKGNNNTSVGYVVTFNGCQIIQPPNELDISVEDTIKVYVNGVKYSKNYYDLTYTTNTITITFKPTMDPVTPLDTLDEVHIAGKFLLV
jgi:hypothetical protein